MKKLTLIPILLIMLLILNGCSNKKSVCECMGLNNIFKPLSMTPEEVKEHRESCEWIEDELTPNEIKERLKDCK